MAAESIKKRLINSLIPLSEAPGLKDRERVKNAINLLKSPDITIPENDYDNIIDFTLCLTKEIPAILNLPQNAKLKELCLHCMHQLKMADEIKTQRKPGK